VRPATALLLVAVANAVDDRGRFVAIVVVLADSVRQGGGIAGPSAGSCFEKSRRIQDVLGWLFCGDGAEWRRTNEVGAEERQQFRVAAVSSYQSTCLSSGLRPLPPPWRRDGRDSEYV
jgi:hypothetical protein